MNDAQPAAIAPEVKPKSETRDFMVFLLKLALFVFVLRSFIVAPFSIPSESMVPRLLVGDYLLVAKWPYGYSRHSLPWSIPLLPGPGRFFERLPARGDVVVFKAPPSANTDYIKRVIGLPGETIQVKHGQLFIDGQAVAKTRVADFILPETPSTRCAAPIFREGGADGGTQCRYPRFRETLPGGRSYNVLDLFPDAGARDAGIDPDNTGPYTVPAGHLFMMGDNRDNSSDSRFPAADGGAVGFVPLDNLVGRAIVTVFSTDGTAEWLLPWTWFTAARWKRIGEGF